MGKSKLSGGWYISYQDRIEYYDSQQAALIAVDSILASYQSGIWSDKSYFLLGHQDREIVDLGLFDGRYSTSVLTHSTISNMFTIDIYAHNKEKWIFKYGSDLLQQSLKAGYDCNQGYLAERLACDYPGFTAKEWGKYQKVDTPSQRCLNACLNYQSSYCSIDKKDHYITIDNYLGKYQLVKLIDPTLEVTTVEFSIAVIDDKKEWILEYGSDLLRQSLLAGYNCSDRYLQERIANDYPGFEINQRSYPKVNSPDESCLYACLGYEHAYCSSNNQCYYVTIDNYLGKYQLIKPIDAMMRITESNFTSLISRMFVSNSVITKIRAYLSTERGLIVLVSSISVLSLLMLLVGLYTLEIQMDL